MDPAGAGKERSIPKAAARAKAPLMEPLPRLRGLARAASPALSTLSASCPPAQGCPRAEAAVIFGHRDE